MSNLFLKTLAVAALPLLAAVPAGAAVLKLSDGAYDVKLYDCKEDGSACTGTLNVAGGVVSSAFVEVGPQDSLSAPAQINQQTESQLAFSLPGGGNLFWGAIGYYDGPYTFLPEGTLTWAAMGNFTTSLTFKTVVGYSLEKGPIYGEPQTIYEDVIGVIGGWATLTRTGDVPVLSPHQQVYLADVGNLLLPPVLDAQTGNTGAITGLQGIPSCLLDVMASSIRGDKQAIGVPVAFGDPLSVPEPGTLALLGIGLAGLAIGRRRQQAL